MPFISDEEAETWHSSREIQTNKETSMNEQVTEHVVPSAEESRKFFFDLIVSLVGSPNTDRLPTTKILEVAATITKQAQERAKQEGWV